MARGGWLRAQHGPDDQHAERPKASVDLDQFGGAAFYPTSKGGLPERGCNKEDKKENRALRTPSEVPD